MGTLEILNVQGGDVKLSFNTKDAGDAVRAKRYIGEMMRAGFVLLIEVERDGDKAFERALGFDATRGEYIIADYEGPASGNGAVHAATPAPPVQEPPVDDPPAEPADKPKRGRKKRVPMEDANATAVGRSAGG